MSHTQVTEHTWIKAEFQETFFNNVNLFCHCYCRESAYAIISSLVPLYCERLFIDIYVCFFLSQKNNILEQYNGFGPRGLS